MILRRSSLVAVIVAAQVAMTAAALAGLDGAWRAPAAFLALVLVPGWLACSAMLPHLSGIIAVGLAAALGMGMTVVGGLVLHVAGEMGPRGYAAWAVAMTILSSLPQALGRAPAVAVRLPRPGAVLACALAALAAAGAIAIAKQGWDTGPTPSYTEFWLTPREGRYEVGVRSHEVEPVAFAVSIEGPDGEVARYPYVPLKAGETWTKDVTDIVPKAAAASLTARLSRTSAPDRVYRRVTASLRAPNTTQDRPATLRPSNP